MAPCGAAEAAATVDGVRAHGDVAAQGVFVRSRHGGGGRRAACSGGERYPSWSYFWQHVELPELFLREGPSRWRAGGASRGDGRDAGDGAAAVGWRRWIARRCKTRFQTCIECWCRSWPALQENVALQEASTSGEEAALHAEMGASLAMAAVDSEALDSWDWDVFQFTHDQLVPHVLVMFMRLGLTQHEADAPTP